MESTVVRKRSLSALGLLDDYESKKKAKPSLLVKVAAARMMVDVNPPRQQHLIIMQQEKEMIDQISDSKTPLLSVRELANGITYTEPLWTGWKPPLCENKADVDDVHEYLVLKGVEAVAIHGGLDQGEREYAIKAFKEGKKDVLVATDVASKGLHFPDIQHVINYDMPAEIENYVHRIGRTGRCGKTGIATTFINKSQSESTLLDLKRLLVEAKQRITPVLAGIGDPTEDAETIGASVSGVRGCAYCGGLGHRIQSCAKLDRHKKQLVVTSTKDYFGGGGYKAEI